MIQDQSVHVAEVPPFRLGPWTVDPAACELRNGDAIRRLRPKVMDLLATFARNAGEVLSKHCLLDLVWPDVTVGDASLTVAVGELRDALGDDPESPVFIETIPRRGYRLVATVEPLDRNRVRPGGSRFWLTGAGVELVLRQGENLIGRAPEAHIRIESPKVSRRHATIIVDGDTAVVEDVGSKNGTFVGDVKVDGPTPLGHGDELRLGQLAALLRIVVADRESTITELSKEFATESVADDSSAPCGRE
jgi:DNA-binding winged helix-turn-helix (wHTH) protein